MKTASSLFSAADQTRVEDAITAAEKTTSAQIVPVVASASGRYDRAEDLFGVLFALLCLGVAWSALQGTGEAAWSGAPTSTLGLPAVAAIILLGFMCGAWLASHFTILRLPFITRGEMQAEVERAARAAFQSHEVRRTSSATGVLIYVSVYEHMVHVLGDDGVARHIKDEQWRAICDAVIAGMRRGTPAAGLVDGLQQTAALLAPVLPRQDGATNELGDHLILID